MRHVTTILAVSLIACCLPSWAEDRLYLPVDPDAESTFKRLEELGERGQWDRVVAGLDTLLAEGGDRLMEIEGRYRSVRAEARSRLLALNGDGRVAYDLVHGEEARRLFELGLERSGTLEFDRILAEHPASKQAARVRPLLVGRLIEGGSPAAALPHIKVLLEGRLEIEDRRRFQRLRALVLALAGRRGEAMNALNDLEDQGPEAVAELTARIDALRAAPARVLQDPAALAWSQEVFGYYEIFAQGSRPWSTPAVDAAIAYSHDGSHAIAVHLGTGKLLWRTPLRDSDAFHRPEGLCPLALGQGVVLCVLPGERGMVALERVSGRLLWKRKLEQLKGEAKVDFQAHLATTAPPRIAGGVAAVALVTDHQDREVHLLGVDLFTGELAWSVFVASEAGAATPYPVLAEEDGRFFVTTGHGAVGAVDAAGEVLWVRTYESKRDTGNRNRNRRRVFPLRGGRRGQPDPRPPTQAPTLMAARGLLWSSPADGKGIEAFDVVTGERRAQVALEAARLLGEHGGGVLALTKTGELHHVKRSGAKQVATIAGAIDTSSARVGDTLYVGGGQGIFAVNLTNGAVEPVGPWKESKGPGNLAASGGRLVVAAPRGLYAYGEQATPATEVAAEDLVAALGDDRYRTREYAAAKLLHRGDSSRDELKAAQQSTDAEVALRASRLLGELQRVELLARWQPLVKPEWGDSVPDLLNRLSHPNPQVRLDVLHALGSIKDDDVFALMRDLLKDSDVRVAFAAAGTLIARGDRAGAEHLASMLKQGKTTADRLQAAVLLTRHGVAEDYEALLAGLKDVDPEVRAAVIGGVFKFGRERCLPLIKPLFKDESTSVRLAAINHLVASVKTRKPKEDQAKLQWMADPAEAMDLWSVAAADENDQIRGKAIMQVAKVRTPRAYKILGSVLGDKVRTTARAAAAALYSVSQSQDVLLIPVDGLEKGSRHTDVNLRNYVSQIAIRFAEAEGVLSVPTLARFMGDSVLQIREYSVYDPADRSRTGWADLLHQALSKSAGDEADAAAMATLILFDDPDYPDNAREVRLKAYKVLRDAVALPRSGRLLAQGLADARPAIRLQVAEWLTTTPISHDGVAEIVRISLRATRPEAKIAASKLLDKLPAERLFPALLPLLGDGQVPEDLKVAARARLAAASENALTFEPGADPAASQRPFAIWWWQRKHPGLTPEQLLAELKDANPSVRWRASQRAASLPLPKIRDALIHSLADEPASFVLKAKLEALVEITGKRHGFDEKGKLPELEASAAKFRAWLKEREGK